VANHGRHNNKEEIMAEHKDFIKISVEIPIYDVLEIQKNIKESYNKKYSLEKIAKAFVQNLINRYFSIEYLDPEELIELIEEEF